MAKVDLSKYITYTRYQWGSGCYNYALMAIWDILNELHCPNSPNMSMAFAQHLLHRPDLWSKDKSPLLDPYPNYYRIPDGRWIPMPSPANPQSPYENDIMKTNWMQTFGNSTEGSQPSIGNWGYDAAVLPDEAVNESSNYRMATTPTKIGISTAEFKAELDKYHPIYLPTGPHVVAVVGYDDALKRFKFIDSLGDSFYDDFPINNPFQGGAFGSFTYEDLDAKKTSRYGAISGPLIFNIIPPKPVPTAKIWIKHNSNRNNINLWLSVENSPKPKKKIWPAWERNDERREGHISYTLNFTVRLPSEFMWPPSHENRLVLDLYDSDAIDSAFLTGGGEVIAFRACFGNCIVNCEEILNNHPKSISFNSNEHRRFYIP